MYRDVSRNLLDYHHPDHNYSERDYHGRYLGVEGEHKKKVEAARRVVDLHEKAVHSQKQGVCLKHQCQLVASEMTGAGPLYICSLCEEDEWKRVDQLYQMDIRCREDKEE